MGGLSWQQRIPREALIYPSNPQNEPDSQEADDDQADGCTTAPWHQPKPVDRERDPEDKSSNRDQRLARNLVPSRPFAPERRQENSEGMVTFFRLEVQAESERYHAEIVCLYPPTFAADRAACAGYTSRIAIPHRGDRVRITGPLVRDLRHDESFRELEIHPVTGLVIL